MSLTAALHTARTSLLTTAERISVSGANIAGADDPGYARRTALATTNLIGDLTTVVVNRAADHALQQQVLTASAASAGQQALADGLERLHATVGDTDSGQSPAAKIAALATALRVQASAPAEPGFAQATLSAAIDLSVALNEATAVVTDVRNDANAGIAASVTRATDLLQEIETLNAAAVRGALTGSEISGILDRRDAAIAALGGEIGIRVAQRANHDIAIHTESGVTLFDKTARTISFDAGSVMAPGSTGAPVLIDGVPATGPNATMALRTGTIAGLAELRDTVGTAYQAQLDEIARGLIEATAETYQASGSGPDLAGLFTHNGGPAIPAAGIVVDGLASSIAINPLVDPTQGGSTLLLRDGGINGASYLYNAAGAASFADRLNEMADGVEADRTFDLSAGLGPSASLSSFAEGSIGWIEGLRQAATEEAEYRSTLLTRASDALSSTVGVNLDDEYIKQMQLEQSYAASSKLLGVIDEMFTALMRAVA